MSFFDQKYLKFSWNLTEITERRSDQGNPENVSMSGGPITERSPDEQMMITNRITGGRLLDINAAVERLLAA